MSTSTRAALAAAAIGAVAAGYVIGFKAEEAKPLPPAPTLKPMASHNVYPVPVLPPAPRFGGDLQASFQMLAATLPADVGVAVSTGNVSATFGTWQNGAAWSTIKVPLSIAALRKDAVSAESPVRLAITQSDNSSADRLWAMLGAPPDAGVALQAILTQGGNPEVTVETQQVRPPYSPYGQTTWSLTQAANFAFHLPCLAADSVLDEMRTIAPDQQWGLAGHDDVAAKGGWGPEPDGGYLVRQMALIGDSSNSFGVAIAAKPTNGSFSTGTTTLDQLTTWVLDHQREFPHGGCAG